MDLEHVGIFMTKQKMTFDGCSHGGSDHYGDDISPNVYGGMVVTVYGQNAGASDKIVEVAVENNKSICIFWREKLTDYYTYLGVASSGEVVRRSFLMGGTRVTMMCQFVIGDVQSRVLSYRIPGDRKPGCYKRGALVEMGYDLERTFPKNYQCSFFNILKRM